jgi:hypothetical protein
MRIGIMQPYFFPYIGYFALINAVDRFVLYDDVAYIKNGWINRNRIKIGTQARYISVPVTLANTNHPIKDVKIVNYDRFRIEVFKTLRTNYSKAPSYADIIGLLTEVFSVDYADINTLNAASIFMIKDYLDIKSEILASSTIKTSNELRGEAKVMNICKILGGDIYINAIGGQGLYSKDNFLKGQINLLFIKMGKIIYFQGKGDFIPDLSIIDVLMWNSKEVIKRMLQEYVLV